jgi:hypothetical protein
MSRQCNHPTCGETCRRPKKEKKRCRLRPYSLKRQAINKVYNPEARQFVKNNPKCAINSPNCTGRTQGVHHKKGRGSYLMDKSTWIPACNPCNDYCEDHSQWAIDNGHKESRLTI